MRCDEIEPNTCFQVLFNSAVITGLFILFSKKRLISQGKEGYFDILDEKNDSR